MKQGTINCTCGQQFIFENTEGISINCIGCSKIYDISMYPDTEEKIEEDVSIIEVGE